MKKGSEEGGGEKKKKKEKGGKKIAPTGSTRPQGQSFNFI